MVVQSFKLHVVRQRCTKKERTCLSRVTHQAITKYSLLFILGVGVSFSLSSLVSWLSRDI